MIISIEASGKTREAAVCAALADPRLSALGVTEDDVSTEILVMPKSGFLGIGAVPAKVLVTYDDGKPEPKAQRRESAPEKAPEPRAPKAEKKPEAKKPRPEKKEPASEKKAGAPAGLPEGTREERTRAFLSGLLERMGVEADIVISPREGGGLDVKLDGPNMGAVIGRRGETLDAIQHLVNYAVNRGGDKHAHINVDAEDYRSKREESLVHLAEKMAAKAIKYKRSMALEPMNSYERHVIHTALQNYEGVSTSSTGTEPNRRVVVNYERPAGESEEPRRERGRGDRRGAGRSSKPREAAAPQNEKPAKPEQDRKAEEALPPDYPEGYTPPSKNKPQSREWC